MPQMNKKVGGLDDRRAKLEADLIGDEIERGQQMETGRTHVNEGTKFQKNANRQNRSLAIQQGVRRRHPHSVLNQFSGITKTTSSAAMTWEQAMTHETKRVILPKEFRPRDDSEGMANQMGVVTTALDNYKASRGKFSRMHLVNV
jgi:hypothetical protein